MSTKKDCMGLGLSICRSIVEAHIGKTEPNLLDGAIIQFTLPLARGAGDGG